MCSQQQYYPTVEQTWTKVPILQPRRSQKTIRTNPKTHKQEAPEIPAIIAIKIQGWSNKIHKRQEKPQRRRKSWLSGSTHTKNQVKIQKTDRTEHVEREMILAEKWDCSWCMIDYLFRILIRCGFASPSENQNLNEFLIFSFGH